MMLLEMEKLRDPTDSHCGLGAGADWRKKSPCRRFDNRPGSGLKKIACRKEGEPSDSLAIGNLPRSHASRAGRLTREKVRGDRGSWQNFSSSGLEEGKNRRRSATTQVEDRIEPMGTPLSRNASGSSLQKLKRPKGSSKHADATRRNVVRTPWGKKNKPEEVGKGGNMGKRKDK